MNILLINDDIDVGGTQTHLIELSKYLIRNGNKVFLVAKEGSLKNKIPKKVKYYNLDIKGKNPFKFLRNYIKLRDIILRNDIDVIHAHYIIILPLLYFIQKYSRNNIVIISTVHKILKDTIWGKNNIFLYFGKYFLDKYSDGIILLNDISLSEFKGHISNKYTIIPNGINMNDLGVNRKTNNILKIGYCGRFIKHKNIDLIIKAFYALSKEYDEIELVLIGDGPTKKEIEKLVAFYDLEDRVQFTGVVDNVIKYLSGIDIYITTSKSEGISYSMLEVLSLGKMIVAFDVPGINDLVKNGYNGFIVQYPNVDLIIKRLKYIILNSYLVGELGMNSRKLVETNYSMEKIGPQIIYFYKKYLQHNAKN